MLSFCSSDLQEITVPFSRLARYTYLYIYFGGKLNHVTK